MSRRKHKTKGSALIVVLFIVMVATILSLGFISRSDIELACGENMLLRTQIDYLAESGLERARGLLMNVESEYWAGDVRQQLYSSNDFYDVGVTRLTVFDPNDPNQPQSYEITCTAYRETEAGRSGESTLKAELYVDPLAESYFRSIQRN